MAKIQFNNINAGQWLGCLTGLTLFACQSQGQDYEPDWTRNLRIGPIVGFNISASFSMKGNVNISANRPAGVYDDGYVRVDGTGNAEGYTSFWGYTDAAHQYNAASQTLTMHNATSYTLNSSADGNAKNNDAPYIGLDLAYGGIIQQWNQFRLGWEFGFNWLPIQITDSHSMLVNVNRSVYSFDTGGITMPVVKPTDPYNGGSSGIGSPIHATPTQLANDQIGGTVTGSRTLDVSLYALKLGPTIFWDVSPYIGLTAGIGPAVGIVSGDLKFDETLSMNDGSITHSKGHIGATDVTVGAYVNAMITYHAARNGDYYLGVQYMPMRSANISGDGHQARLNLGGQVYLSAGINWPF